MIRIIRNPFRRRLKTSEKGIEFIKRWEGLRLKRYKCSANVNTIGYGHTGWAARKYTQITKELADKLLREDIKESERAVNKLVRVKLTQGQFDALVSFVFNFGETKFAGSTLLRKLNNKEYLSASAQFLRWVFSNGKRSNGLMSRREEESAMFSSEVG